MKTIYKSEKGKEEILNLYDSQLSRLKAPWKEVYVDTSFGKTHIMKNKQENPIRRDETFMVSNSL